MRSIPLMAATTVILAAAWGCGGDGGGDTGNNHDPVASFTVAGPCTVGVPCAFTDASSDPEGANTITSRSWDFNNDGTPESTGNEVNPSFTYAAAGSFTAKLTVTDDAGNTASTTVPVTVNPASTGNTPPIAAFTVPACTVNSPCLFSDLSSDAESGTPASWSWTFGDNPGAPAVTDQNPSHTYTAAGLYDVTLTVTDAQGATGTTTQKVTVSDVAATNCNAGGSNTVSCALDIENGGVVTVALTSRSCALLGDNVRVTQPTGQFVFNNACRGPAPTPHVIVDENGAPFVFAPGTQLQLIFISGQTTSPTDPPVGSPAARMSGSSSTGWVINIDDGGNTGRPGEPDFDDLVLQVTVAAQ
jgi:PKD repeat protein